MPLRRDASERNAREARRNKRAQAVHIQIRDQLDEIEPNEPPFRRHAKENVRNLQISQAARLGNDNGRQHAGIEAVTIDRDKTSAAMRNLIDNLLNAIPPHHRGRDDRRTPSPRVIQVALPRAADSAHADLNDFFDPWHLAGAPHRTGKGVARTGPLVAPVEMCIDLDYRDRSMMLKSLNERDRNGVVAAEQEWHCAGLQHGAGCGVNQCAIVLGYSGIGRQIPGVKDTGLLRILQRSILVEIPPRQVASSLPQCAAQSIGRISRVARLAGNVRCRVGRSEHDDVGVARRQKNIAAVAS